MVINEARKKGNEWKLNVNEIWMNYSSECLNQANQSNQSINPAQSIQTNEFKQTEDIQFIEWI